jgi:hypothetical protein
LPSNSIERKRLAFLLNALHFVARAPALLARLVDERGPDQL